MDPKPLVTVQGECFVATLLRSGGSYETDRTYELRVEDLAEGRGTRGLTVTFTRHAIVNARNFQSREHVLLWNAIRVAFDAGDLSFDSWAQDKWQELRVKDADAPETRKSTSEDVIRKYLTAKLYWLRHRHGAFDSPAQTCVHLDAEEDVAYLGATRNDLLRVARAMEQEGLVQPSGAGGAANPTQKLLRLYEARAGGETIMKEHEYALALAARGKLPEKIDAASRLSPSVIGELVGAGLLKAVDASSMDGAAYLNPQITLAGREYLAQLGEERKAKQVGAKMMEGKEPGPAAEARRAPDAWKDIEVEYEVSKRALGRRLSFVRDQFKKRVIFRDIKQAFLLAQSGFYKPSVILAGGVVEELLRLFLEHKDVKPGGNTLDSYLKSCVEHHFIKVAVHNLADSVRHFRNLVHLEGEKSESDSISMATAKGAVASIFTISKELSR
jgi:hypothetical protein